MPQTQEFLIHDVADFLDEFLKPEGLAIHCSAVHECMTTRGVKSYATWMETVLLRGEFRDNPRREAAFNSIVMHGRPNTP